METENNRLICYEKEINYIAKQIKIMLNLDEVFVEYYPRGLLYRITFVGHPLFTFRVKIIHLEELIAKSYITILKEIIYFLIDQMEN